MAKIAEEGGEAYGKAHVMAGGDFERKGTDRSAGAGGRRGGGGAVLVLFAQHSCTPNCSTQSHDHYAQL